MMKTGTGALAAALTATVVLAGCTSSRIGALDTGSARTAGPAPLAAAPSGTVTSGQLPPPAQPQVANANPNQFPEAPGANQPQIGDLRTDTVETDTPVTTEEPRSSVQQVASAEPVTREALVGAWQVSTSGSSCQMFMALTKWTGGYRAASRGCPGDAANVSAWDVQGSQVVLSDSSGNKVATLFSSGNGRYDGQTTGGRAISLSR